MEKSTTIFPEFVYITVIFELRFYKQLFSESSKPVIVVLSLISSW